MKEAVVKAFARSIFAKAELLRSADLNRREERRVLEAVSVDIRKYADLIDHGASDAALALAATLGVDLRSVGWHDQETFDPRRKLFALEHVVPVNQLRKACLDARSEVEVARCLAAARVAWICREEDEALTRLDYRSVRPDPGLRTELRAYLSPA